MLMKAYVDYNLIKAEHEEIHLRLQNWAKWTRVGRFAWMTHPMWRYFKEREPQPSSTCNTLDAHEVEKLIADLPQKNRQAIRWWYVYASNPKTAAKQMGVTLEVLDALVHDGRTMLKDRSKPLAKPEIVC